MNKTIIDSHIVPSISYFVPGPMYACSTLEQRRESVHKKRISLREA
ncbi:MAG: hypothetical protein GY765_11380 [bacterium]|nr:hypothetical protein [bacterium]